MKNKMILVIYGISLIGLGNCYPQFNLPPNFKVLSPEDINSLEIIDTSETRSPVVSNKINRKENSIEKTIKEVEDMIKNNPHLPRLTRGEILDLIENITKEEALKTTRGGKNLMVVMPYTPQEDGKNIEDLFTKPPVTQIIGNDNDKVKDLTENKNKRRRPQVKFTQKPRSSTTAYTTRATTTTTEKATTTSEKAPRNRRRRPTTSVTTPLTLTTPEFVTKIPISATTYHRTRPVRRRTTTTTTSPPEIITKYSNHRYPGEDLTTIVYEPSNGFKIIDPPKLNLPQYLAEEETVPQSSILVENIQNNPNFGDIEIPQNLRNVVKDMNLESAFKSETKEPEVQTASPEDKLRLKELLESLGVLADSTTSSTTSTSTTTKLPNVANVAESLSPEMRQLLMSFGLLPDPSTKGRNEDAVRNDRYYPEKPDVSPESYVGFKPLPSDDGNREDMNALLATFGLGRSARKEKSLKSTQNKNHEEYNLDMIPDNLKGVLTDLGLSTRQEKKIENNPKMNNFEENKNKNKEHVFNPDEQYASEDELEKLDKLLSMIKELEKLNGTASDEDLKKIDLETLKDLVGSLNQAETLEGQESGPDPIYESEDILSKNEIKRQTSTTSTTTSTTTTAASITTTEASEAKKESPSLSDLEESFGGKTSTTTEAPTTTSKPNGFYYLVDWNSFLDIDDQNGRRVNLRFQPKVGNPKNFLSVQVP